MRQNRGYTVIELVMIITLMGMIASIAALSFKPALDSWSLGSSRSQETGSIRYALNRMMDEMASIKDSTSVITASASTFQFKDINNTNINYVLTGTNLMRNNDILAQGIQSLSFSYWDMNQQTVANPKVSPAVTDLWRISIQISGQSGDQQVKMEAQIHPRNLMRS